MDSDEKTTSGKQSHRHRSSSKKSSTLYLLEHFITRHLLKIVGILFMIASLWFAASSTDTVVRIVQTITSPETFLQAKEHAHVQDEPVTNDIAISSESIQAPVSFYLIILAIVIVWSGFQWLARWRKRTEFQVVSVFFVFITWGLLIQRFGWKIEWIFPAMILFSWGLFYFGRHLGHMGSRLNIVFSWGLIILYWLLKVMIEGNRELLVPFFILIPLFFLSFHIIGLLQGFSGHRKINRTLEAALIVLNIAVFYLVIAFTLIRFYQGSYLFVFTLAISIVYIGTILLMEWKEQPYRKAPFFFSGMVLLSLLLPLLFKTDQIILFNGTLAIFLMTYSRFSKDQPSIIISLALTVIMTMFYLKDILLTYIPAFFSGEFPLSLPLFIKGLVAGLFIPAVVYIQRSLLKKIYIRFSHKWFSRRRYLKILKGIFLVILYLGLFWIWQFFFFLIVPAKEGMFINWFIYHCIYFLITIPLLAAQRSSFLKPAMVTVLVLSFLYPLLLSIQNLVLLEMVIEKITGSAVIFYLHYLSAAMFVALLLVILRYRRKTFRENRTMRSIVVVYCVVMGLFLAFSEMILTVVAVSAESKIRIDEIMERLYKLPATLILVGMAVILVVAGLMKSNRFLRILAFSLIIIASGKIILYDITTLHPLTRVLLLFLSGTGLLVFSIIYIRIKRKEHHRHSRHHRISPALKEGDLNNQNTREDEETP